MLPDPIVKQQILSLVFRSTRFPRDLSRILSTICTLCGYGCLCITNFYRSYVRNSPSSSFFDLFARVLKSSRRRRRKARKSIASSHLHDESGYFMYLKRHIERRYSISSSFGENLFFYAPLTLQVSIFTVFGGNFETYITLPRSRRDLAHLSLRHFIQMYRHELFPLDIRDTARFRGFCYSFFSRSKYRYSQFSEEIARHTSLYRDIGGISRSSRCGIS